MTHVKRLEVDVTFFSAMFTNRGGGVFFGLWIGGERSLEEDLGEGSFLFDVPPYRV